MTRAVVFAYHNVGARCLRVLLAHGIEVPLVVTHADAPTETIWFERVADIARLHGIETMLPAVPDAPELRERMVAAKPDFAFSFYYRHMLDPALLAVAPRGAFNMHGSLLPKYRGRVPVNWAVLHGERETGATLHEMVAKPDAGRIVDQLAVPILPNDTAHEVFAKVTVAAEIVLDRSIPRLVDGSAVLHPQDLARGSYFSGRRPEEGQIDWTRPAWTIHNLVRAVAPPYPGAFSRVNGFELRILRTHWIGATRPASGRAAIAIDGDRLRIAAVDGGLLDVLDATLDGAPLDLATFHLRFGRTLVLDRTS